MDLRLVPAAMTSWAVTAAAILWPTGIAIAWASATVGVIAAMLWWRGRERVSRSVAAGLLGASVVGAGFGWAAAMRSEAVREHPIVHRVGAAIEVTVMASEDPRPLRSGGRVVFRATLRRIGADDASGRVVVFAPSRGFAELTSGRPARFTARVGRPTRRDLSVAVLSATGQPALGEASPVQRAAESVRREFADAARAVLPADEAAMLPALVLGDTSMLSPETTAEFRAAGLTHLTAVSGANVTIVCGAVLLSARVFGPRMAVLSAGAALVGFVVVVQPSASVLRAALMGAITLLGVLSHRRRQAMPALAASVIVLMIAAPELAVDLGFALSVSATAALILIAPVWSRRLVGRGWPKPLADALCVAVAAQLVTAPLIAGITGQVSLISVAANLAAAVVIVPITVLGTAAAAMSPLWPAAAELLVRFTGPEVWWLLRVARWASRVPGATVPVPGDLPGFAVVATASIVAVSLFRWAARRRRRSAVARSSRGF